MNQDKLEVVKQEMASVNVDILGISELKWTRMGEFNSDDHYIYYCGQESLRKWSSHHSQQESLKRSAWVQSPKGHLVSLLCFPHLPFKGFSFTTEVCDALGSS